MEFEVDPVPFFTAPKPAGKKSWNESPDQGRGPHGNNRLLYRDLEDRTTDFEVDPVSLLTAAEPARENRLFGNRLDPNRALKTKREPERPQIFVNTGSQFTTTTKLTKPVPIVNAIDENRAKYLRQRSQVSSSMQEGVSEDAAEKKTNGISFAERAAVTKPIKFHTTVPIQANVEPLNQPTERPRERRSRKSHSVNEFRTPVKPGQNPFFNTESDHMHPSEPNNIGQLTASQNENLRISHKGGPKNVHEKEPVVGGEKNLSKEKKRGGVVQPVSETIREKTSQRPANLDWSRKKKKITNRSIPTAIKISKHASMPLPNILEKYTRSKEPDASPNANGTTEGKTFQTFDQRWNEEEHKKMKNRPGELILPFKNRIPRAGLHHAASLGDQSVIRNLLSRSLDINSYEVGSKFTPLHCAVKAGHVPVVGLLLRRGASIDAMDANQNTPLHHASALSKHELVENLVEKRASLEAADHLGHTPLFICQPDNNSICGLLLRLNANFMARDNEGSTPLH